MLTDKALVALAAAARRQHRTAPEAVLLLVETVTRQRDMIDRILNLRRRVIVVGEPEQKGSGI